LLTGKFPIIADPVSDRVPTQRGQSKQRFIFGENLRVAAATGEELRLRIGLSLIDLESQGQVSIRPSHSWIQVGKSFSLIEGIGGIGEREESSALLVGPDRLVETSGIVQPIKPARVKAQKYRCFGCIDDLRE
jgi:hypothetical protein